jgi:acetylornithine deacetylase/succinyl-diaminopimelate desuccinylase-like protein
MRRKELQQIFHEIDRRFEAYVDDVTEYCSTPTVSARSEGFREGADLTKRLLGQYAIPTKEWEVPEGPPLLTAEVGGKDRPVLILYCHYDVQPEDPRDEWETDPFRPIVKDGNLYGRGTGDTRGNILAQALAFSAISETVGAPPLTVRFMLEGEEEIGSPHLSSFWETHLELFRGDGCTLEVSPHDIAGIPNIELGHKGLLYVEITCRTAERDQHSMLAPSFPNPAWRLLAALRTLRDDEGRILIPGFYDKARRPTEEEEAYIERSEFDPLDLQADYGAVEVLGGEDRVSRVKQLIYGTTCNIDGLVAGYTQEGVKTINPAVAKAKIDFRLIPDQQPEDILEKLRAHLREGGFDDVDVEHKASFESASTPISSAIGRALIQGCEDVYARPPNVFPWSIGSGPTSFYTKVGTPTGTAPGVNYTGSRIHAPNEHIRLADARNAIKAVASAILAFADIAGSSVRHS